MSTVGQNGTPRFVEVSWLWLNGFVWTVIIGLNVHIVARYSAHDYTDALRTADSIALSVATLVLTFGVTFYGFRISTVLFSSKGNARVAALKWKIVATAVVCTVCFTLRSVFWLWEPITGEYSPHGTYPWLFYTCNELLPSLMLFLSLAPIP